MDAANISRQGEQSNVDYLIVRIEKLHKLVELVCLLHQ